MVVKPVAVLHNNSTLQGEKCVKEKIDLLHQELYYKLAQLKLRQTQFVFKAKPRRKSRKRKLHIKHNVSKRKKYNKRKKKNKICLRKIKLLKQQKVLTNTFHNQMKVKSSLSKLFSLFKYYKQ